MSEALSKQVLISRLPKELKANHINRMLKQFGTIKKIHMPVNKKVKASVFGPYTKGHCYVTFESKQVAKNVVAALDGYWIGPVKISVGFVKSKELS